MLKLGTCLTYFHIFITWYYSCIHHQAESELVEEVISVVEDAIRERIPLWYRVWMELDNFQVDENEINRVRALTLLEIRLYISLISCNLGVIKHISPRKDLHKMSFKLKFTRNCLRGSIWTSSTPKKTHVLELHTFNFSWLCQIWPYLKLTNASSARFKSTEYLHAIEDMFSNTEHGCP